MVIDRSAVDPSVMDANADTGHDPVSSRPRLLIADDDGTVQAVLHRQLAEHFDIVGSAFDADEAIALAAARRPDVAIIDVQMPGGGGVRAARELSALDPRMAIVALSGDESDTIVRAMLQAGAILYLRKGMGGPELVRGLRRAIAAQPGFMEQFPSTDARREDPRLTRNH
jgi:DNA-binding NarL/FixJ family response regulator